MSDIIIPEGITPNLNFFTADISTGRTEAEDLSIASGFFVSANGHASNGSYLQANSDYSNAGGIFSGAAGSYDIKVGFFDEDDGVSIMELWVNGTAVESFTWDQVSGTDIVNDASRSEVVISGVYLAPDDVIELRGMADRREPLRTDFIEISASDVPIPSPDAPLESFRVELEDLAPYFLDIYDVTSNGAASGDAVIQTNDRLWATYEVEKAGSFDITLGYCDETDGVSELTIDLNGVVIGYIKLDDTDGSVIANNQSARTFTLQDIALEEGDSLTLRGNADGGEPLRLDYLDFQQVVPGSGPAKPSLPDLWYLDGDEVYLSLNGGVYEFYEERTRIIVTDYGGVDAEDFDGDGDSDFFVVEVGNPFPLPDSGSGNVPGELTLTTTFYENDGTGSFAVASQEVGVFEIDWNGFGLWQTESLHDIFKFADAADMDGDGDVDFFGFSVTAQRMLVFENGGDGIFTMLPPQIPSDYGELSFNGNDGFFADMNGDDYLDILYSGANEVNATHVLINDGSGIFSSIDSISDSDDGNAYEVVGDLDGDGDNDFALIGVSDGGTISAYINDGSGAREAGLYPYYDPSYETWKGALAIGDVDGDGINEIITGGLRGGSEDLPTGLRTFEVDIEGNTLVLDSYDPEYFGNVVAAEDFDADGDLDLLFVDLAESAAGMGDYVLPRILLNDGEGVFSDAPFGFTTGIIRGNYYYGPPEVNIGYFDDTFMFA